jgi:hypothetical protein
VEKFTPKRKQMTHDGYFKVLVAGVGSASGATWSLPGDDAPGEWMTVDGPLVMCQNGLHVTDWQGVWQHWITFDADVYRVEVAGDVIGDITSDGRKIATSRARLISKMHDALPPWWIIAQQFVAELPTYNWLKPDGNPDPSWQLFPTRAAAWYATGSAARVAAREAAGSAAGSAAREAAGSAAGSAAWSAAWDAAGDAALSAAGDATWVAVREAVWATARDAAKDATTHARVLIASDRMNQAYIEHTTARMDVWRKGYGLFRYVDGDLYVYEALS